MEENEDKLEQITKQKAKEVERDIGTKAKNTAKKTALNTIKTALKIVFSKMGIIIAIMAILIIMFLAAVLYFLEDDDSENLTAYGKYSINSVLGLDDISELVTINGTPQDGYSLAFVDDIDEKLEEVINASDDYKERKITDPKILKQYIKAELVTQLPYLGEGVPASKLPNLDGVDILYEPEETTNLVNSLDGMIMLGDSFTVRLHNSGLLEDGCEYYAMSGVAPQYWLDRINTLPDDASGVCVLLGVNNPWQITEMQQLIEKLIQKYPGKPIYVQKVFPLGKNYTANNRETTQAQIDKFNDEIEQYCGQQDNAFWIDTTSGYVDEFGYLITNDSEGLHIDENNQNKFASNIKSKILREYGATSGSDSDELQGSNEKEAIWAYLISKGFSEEATAGIMGNWYEETQFRSNAVQGDYRRDDMEAYDEEMTKQFQSMTAEGFAHDTTGGGGYGLAQWTDPSRKEKLYNFAQEQGKDLDDLKMQLDFFMWECENTNEFLPLLEDDFKNITDIDEAARKFHSIYEMSADNETGIQERVDAGKNVWDELHGTIPSGSYSTSARKKAMAVTDRQVDEENEFQAAVKLKRVIPKKEIGELSEVDGKVVEMTYVPQGVFNAYINQQNKNVLEVFTINNNREIVFAKWSYDSDNGVKYAKASSVNIATVMEKYTMPYDYLMILNVYGKDIDFCLGLADLAIESEYIVAIQDQVTTTKTVTEIGETVTRTLTDEAYANMINTEILKSPIGIVQDKLNEYNKELLAKIPKTTTTTASRTNTKITETVSEKIELSYADSWAITVHNEVTYKDEKEAKREDVAMTSTQSAPETTVTTENTDTATITTTTVTTVSTSSVTNKYSSGKTTVEEEKGGDKFVELYKKADGFKRIEPTWLFEALNANARTAKMVDLTKYLLYKATHEDFGVLEPKEVFAEYEENKFKQVKQKNKGTVGWAFTRAWENNELRKFMEGDDTYAYDTTPNIYTCVTSDKTKYILHDELDRAIGNKIYGVDVRFYDMSVGYKWQNVDLFKEQGVNIKESEYNIYSKSQIDVEVIEKISIKAWNNLKERVKRIAEMKKVKLKSYQIDCLTDILYTKGNVYKIVDYYAKLEGELDKEKDKEGFQALGNEFQGARGEARWILFSEGRYPTPIQGEDLDPSDYAGGGEFYELAYELHEYLRENEYWYPSAANIAAGGYVSDGESVQQKLPVRGEAESSRYVDCSSYVSWVISEYIGENHCWYTGSLINNPMDFEVIATSTSEYTEEDLLPGDILVAHNDSSQHTEIYAGEGKTLNCGSTDAIRSEFSNYVPNKFTHVFRPPD